MPANFKPIFPLTPTIGICDLSGATALTARTVVTGTTGLTAITPTSTNGKRIDAIRVKCCQTVAGAAAIVCIWVYDGTKSYLFDELSCSAVTPGNTTEAFSVEKTYSNLVLPPTYRLYASITVSSAGNTNCIVTAHGGDY